MPIGEVTQQVKIAAGLFWADYAALGAQIRDLEVAGVDWLHIEVRDGKYMDFAMPRGGYDIIEATCNSTSLEVEAQLQMLTAQLQRLRSAGRSGRQPDQPAAGDDQRDDLSEHHLHQREAGAESGRLGLAGRAGRGLRAIHPSLHRHNRVRKPGAVLEGDERRRQSRIPSTPSWWIPYGDCTTLIADAGLEGSIELMEDGGLNAGNVAQFIEAGMTVGEFSSPLLKGPGGKLQPGTGAIGAAVEKLRAVMREASDKYRDENGLKK